MAGAMEQRHAAWSMTIALVLGSLPLVAGLGTPQGAIPIVGDVTYADGTFVFPENLVVGPGSTLTFRNAHVYLDAPLFCPSRGTAGYCQPSILVTGGTLRILDSVIDSHGYSASDPESGWNVAGIGAVFVIEGSTLTHYKSLGTQSPGLEPSLVQGNAFVDGRGPLAFIRGAEATVQGNLFQDVYEGVSFHDSPSLLQDNVFRHVGRDYGLGRVGRAIDVESTVVGDKAYRAMTRVEGNLVEDAVYGMLNLNGFPNEIRNNVFRDTKMALVIGVSVGDNMLHSEAPIVEGNRFERSGDAIGIYTSGLFATADSRDAVTIRASGNSFVGTACREVSFLGVSPRVDMTVDVRGNWWGSDVGPQDRGAGCPAFPAAVAYDPWLTQAP